ncbi:MAG: HD domain-containing protein [Candidatus Omnitrophica bacterium]|nr:HD domain-containing protein [Candidatus Omnitrophota bacterium]
MKEYIAKQVQDSYAEMLLRFAIAAEYKDDEIGSHIIRVSDYSTAIAKALSLSSKRVKMLRFASIMHDIGKIGIPDNLLRKKKITKKDYNRIKKHTVIGGKVFSGANAALLKAAGEIAFSHHEWYDGTGYPLGLKGRKIPLYARIVALADSLDAIVSERSYKKSETVDKAVQAIKKRSGTQFDPGIAEAFLRALPSIKEIFLAGKTISNFLKENKRLLNKE